MGGRLYQSNNQWRLHANLTPESRSTLDGLVNDHETTDVGILGQAIGCLAAAKTVEYQGGRLRSRSAVWPDRPIATAAHFMRADTPPTGEAEIIEADITPDNRSTLETMQVFYGMDVDTAVSGALSLYADVTTVRISGDMVMVDHEDGSEERWGFGE